MPKVSVIIPTRNRKDFLLKTIDSVLNQTFKNLEIIVVDDGSTDNTEEFLSKYIKDNLIKYIRYEKSNGSAFARNIGIRESSGEYIAFLDDDDEWLPLKIEHQVKYLDLGFSMCSCQLNVIKSKTQKVYISSKRKKFKDDYKSIMYDNFIGSTSSFIVQRKCLEKTDLFDVNLKMFQDYDLYIRLLKNGETLYRLDKPYVNYNIDGNRSRMTTNSINYYNAMKYLSEKYKNEKYYYLLSFAFKRILLKRAIRYPAFGLEYLKMTFWRFMKLSG